MSTFIQMIEFSTTRFDEVEALNDRWRERFPKMGPTRVSVCADHNRAGTYVAIVEFTSYEEAMRNSADPATDEYAQLMAALCDGPAVFRDLDVVRTEIRTPSQRTAAMESAPTTSV